MSRFKIKNVITADDAPIEAGLEIESDGDLRLTLNGVGVLYIKQDGRTYTMPVSGDNLRKFPAHFRLNPSGKLVVQG